MLFACRHLTLINFLKLTGKHLSLKQVADLVSPSQAVVNKVIAWLASHGVTKYSIPVTQDFVKATVTAKKASELLATNFHQFMHINTGTYSNFQSLFSYLFSDLDSLALNLSLLNVVLLRQDYCTRYSTLFAA